MGHDEGCFLRIMRVHRNLMVSEEGVQKRQNAMPGCCIHNLIYTWQREAILGTCFIEINVVYTYAPLTTLFWYYYHIGQPFGVLHLPYKPCFLKIVYLCLNDLMSVRVEPPHPLPYWISHGKDVQIVRSHLWTYPNHVKVFPGEYINVTQQRET